MKENFVGEKMKIVWTPYTWTINLRGVHAKREVWLLEITYPDKNLER